MRWWERLWPGAVKSAAARRVSAVQLGWPDWNEDAMRDGARLWWDADGDLLSVTTKPGPFYIAGLPASEFQDWSRNVAQGNEGGLIECHAGGGNAGSLASLIYKQRHKSGYNFTGMLFISDPEFSLVWTAVAKEHGTTGVREAVVTAKLFNAGLLTIENYEHLWAHDPYDPVYLGHDRSVLRFISDHESYDSQFPSHPLSKVRRVMAALRARQTLN